MMPKSESKIVSEVVGVARLAGLLRPHLTEVRMLGLAATTLISGIALQLPLPLVTRHLIDQTLPHGSYSSLTIVIVLLLGVLGAKTFADLLYAFWITVARERMLLSLQMSILRHVICCDLLYFRSIPSGYLATRINSDVATLGGMMSSALINAITNVATLIVGAVIMVFIQPKLALLCFALLPLFVLSQYVASRKIRHSAERYQEAFAQSWDSLHEAVASIEIIKAYAAESSHSGKVERALQRRVDASITLTLASALAGAYAALMSGVGPILVLWLGGYEVMTGRMSLGSLVAFSAFVGYLFAPTRGLMDLGRDLQQALASGERIRELLNIRPKVQDPVDPFSIGSGPATVELRNVSFRYDTRPILEDINVSIADGELVGVIGKSGSGKTSLIQLIPRLYDPTSGSVLISGIDARDLLQNELRKWVGIVPQDALFMAGSIRDNVCLGAPNATDAQVWRALETANAHDFVARLPQGLQTEIGERGVRLSGGERQRLALARAMIREPQILILDEATSEVDAESERLIQESIAALARNRTTIVVAHRFSTVLSADQILVVESGRIIDSGSHNELHGRCPTYTDLYSYQTL